MAKQWSFAIHREYNRLLKRVVSDKDRYPLGVAIRDRLEMTDDPTEGASPVPNRPGRFTIELMGYIVPFEVPVDRDGNVLADATIIKLLPIEST